MFLNNMLIMLLFGFSILGSICGHLTLEDADLTPHATHAHVLLLPAITCLVFVQFSGIELLHLWNLSSDRNVFVIQGVRGLD